MADNPDSSAANADLADMGRSLEAFANGPARTAGEALQASFARAASAIRAELSQLAKSGEADLERLGRAMAETLARLALNQLAGQRGGGGEAGGPVNVTMNFSGSASNADAASSNQIAAAVARAVRRGARFS